MLEDCIMKKGSVTSAGSKMLENFVAPFDAAVVERLRDCEIEVEGSASMNEFGIPSFFGDNDSTSDAVKAVVGGTAPFCLCNDLFGQYRRAVAENDVCYIHPTYGTVSRYGLIPLAQSMDQIGVLCKNLTDGFSVLSKIAGHDSRDGAMFPESKYEYQSEEKQLKVCAPSSIIARADEKTQNNISEFCGKFTVVNGELNYFDTYKQVMYILSSAEISHNFNRYDGVKFGYRSEDSRNLESLYTNSRTEAFGIETKLTSIMGAFVLSAEQYVPYYEKAMKIRRLIKQSLNFDEYDIIVLPASISDEPYENLSLYALSALAGLPSVSFSYNGCGIQLIANVKNENALLTAWEVANS